jgi:GT2 family glycosyltransferase
LSAEVDSHPYVGVVLLNWNGTEDTLACLESLRNSDWSQQTTIVVDNGSDEDIGGELEMYFPDAILIRNLANLGFAGGMNVGIRRALDLGADYVLLLNNDTVVEPSMLSALVDVAMKHPDTGIVSPLELFRDAPQVVASAGRHCNLRHAYQGPPLHMGARDTGQFRGVQEIDVSSGTAMLVPSAVIREVGPLDEELFLYVEDVDWALRMRAAGKRIYVCFDARLWHGVASSSGGEESPQVTYYHARNTFVVSNRHLPMRGPRALLRHLEILFANLVHALRCRRPLANVMAVLEGWRDYRAGRLGARSQNA